MSILSTLTVLFGQRDMKKFGIFFTLGNIIAILGYLPSLFRTTFLTGFHSQFKKMTKDTRLPATIFYFGAMIVTLYAAFGISNPKPQRLLIITGVIVQFCAYFWYSLTFIPFGRRIFKTMCRSCCNKCMEEVN